MGLAPLLALLSLSGSPQGGDPLGATARIQSDHPRIVALAAELTAGAPDARTRAVRIHDFVRDEIRFGWTRSFYAMSAVDVLDAGVGYCNTKATLFIALLRAAGIPARQHFLDISSRVLAGFLESGTPFLDHSFTEVQIDGRWLRVDSYVVDVELWERARAQLERSGAGLGWGVHRNGTPDWDGRSDAFVQFVDDGSVPALTSRDHGVFADVDDFYRHVEGRDELSGLNRVLIPLFIPRSTARVETLRSGR